MTLNNTVILNTNREHGKKIIDFFKNHGVDTRGFKGLCGVETNDIHVYYGLIDGCFSNYSLSQVEKCSAKIITLPEETGYPKVMLVSMDGDRWYKRVVLMKKNEKFISWINAETLEQSENQMRVTPWSYAKEVEEEIVEVTLEQIAEKFNVKVENIKIKK